MVFHGDYEIEFEIYERAPNDWRSQYLGCVSATNEREAKKRWAYQNDVTPEDLERMHAIVSLQYARP
jgi:hypothetical protein